MNKNIINIIIISGGRTMYTYGNLETELSAAFESIALSMIITFVFAAIIGLVFYIFNSVAIFTMAKRRGIKNYGLAWVPIANLWILGSLADQYDFATKGVKKNARKVLLGLGIGSYALMVGYIVTLINFIAYIFVDIYKSYGTGYLVNGANYQLPPGALSYLAAFLISLFVFLVVAIIYSVFCYITFYKIFKSANPSNAVLFIVLSIFFDITPFLLFAVRNKDEGFPMVQQPFNPITEQPPVQTPPQNYSAVNTPNTPEDVSENDNSETPLQTDAQNTADTESDSEN